MCAFWPWTLSFWCVLFFFLSLQRMSRWLPDFLTYQQSKRSYSLLWTKENSRRLTGDKESNRWERFQKGNWCLTNGAFQLYLSSIPLEFLLYYYYYLIYIIYNFLPFQFFFSVRIHTLWRLRALLRCGKTLLRLLHAYRLVPHFSVPLQLSFCAFPHLLFTKVLLLLLLLLLPLLLLPLLSLFSQLF